MRGFDMSFPSPYPSPSGRGDFKMIHAPLGGKTKVGRPQWLELVCLVEFHQQQGNNHNKLIPGFDK